MQRLKTRAQFQAVLAGSVVAKTAHFALHQKPIMPESDLGFLEKNQVWVGALVPKRWAKKAVTRNLIKRQTYTVSANFLPKQVQTAFVVRLRRDFSPPTFVSASSELLKHAVRRELTDLFTRAIAAH